MPPMRCESSQMIFILMPASDAFTSFHTTSPSPSLRLRSVDDLITLTQPLDNVEAGLRTTSGELLALTSVHVRGQVLDVVGRCTLFQEYTNPHSEPIEAKYVFPLDETAAVCGFEAYINDKHIVGQVKEKQQVCFLQFGARLRVSLLNRIFARSYRPAESTKPPLRLVMAAI